ncbi:MAG: GSCFA domain-containing protein [Massilibacteroides sp.]|nr:GSCFA domain-containing protein [Massilibacteroides sp.]MDD3063225.1 GSCFA domain-containing protein [Massilibacteroides sp.]MDD4116511.1 GSCFA domain-containing protein [Massilibacteroides sp.]MDD4659571.1 GSCFA domain-containing protein [Massilibacteroides sp.]
MEFRTLVKFEKALFSFSYSTSILLTGSCFAENIGEKLESAFFSVDANPFGTVYNPASVAFGLRLLLGKKHFEATDLFYHAGAFHSFHHHSRFSASTSEACLQKINDRMLASAETLRKADRLIVTWGTSWVYVWNNNGQIVTNCHKLPEAEFTRKRLSVAEIVTDWNMLLTDLLRDNPSLKILFTVSPIRHWKDGAHGNQLSKATLLLAVDELRRNYPDTVDYFPAYELMMDELRDYRFYADDMLHPSSLAVDYIWKRFSEHYLISEAKTLMAELQELEKAVRHRPFQPEGEAYRAFLKRTLEKAERLYPRVGSRKLLIMIDELRNKIS